MDNKDNLDEYRGRWLWWEDITTFFTLFITIFAVFSVCVSIDRTGKVYIENSFIASAVDLGTNWLPIPLIIFGIWLIILIVLRARGKLKNQQIAKQGLISQLSQSKDFTDALKALTKTQSELIKVLKNNKVNTKTTKNE